MTRKQNLATKYKVGGKEAFKLIVRHTRKRLTEQLKAISMIIIYLIFFQTLVLGIPISDSAMITIGLIMVVTGLTFFMEGLLLGLMPLGEVIGIRLPLKANVITILVIAFILGLGATFAEPAIGVLRVAGQSVKAWSSPLLFLLVNKYANYLVYSVGTGVGLAVVLGMLRFLYGWSLKPFIYILVSVLVLLSLFAYLNPNLNYILGLAWDCGAVTTGPVTVPLILALGIGISHVSSKGGSNSGGGFGVVTLASLLPVIAVLLIGILNMGKVPEPLKQQEFFSSDNRDKAAFLFDNESQMFGYAFKNADSETWLKLFGDDQERMFAYFKKLAADETMIKDIFGSRFEFESWILQQNDIALKLSILGSEEKISELAEKLGGSSVARFDTISYIKRNFLNASQAIVPLSMFLILILFVILRERLPKADEIFLGLFFALIGMAIFSIGIELGLSKVGDQVGGNLPVSFKAIEMPKEQITISDFDEDVVNTAISTDGSSQDFFYIYHKNRYNAVPYNPAHYDNELKSYKYIPTRGPLFGSKERSLIGLLVVLLFAFLMGYGATLAEPALNALGMTVEDITVGTFKKNLLIQSVAIGVGVGISVGLAKIIWDLPLFWMLAIPYSLLLIITRISSEEFVNIGWDSAGVTTGPITVPLVLALGLGTGSQVGVVEGFGILSMASVCPIISVLVIGLIVNYKRKAALQELIEEQVEPADEEIGS